MYVFFFATLAAPPLTGMVLFLKGKNKYKLAKSLRAQ